MRIIHRDRRLNLAVTEAEHRLAVEIARAKGQTLSEMIREILRETHTALRLREARI
jgi:hypothetical protein